MANKKVMILVLMLVGLLAISGVSASEIDDNSTFSLNDDETVESTPDGTFSDLANEIANASGELNLTRNYVFSQGDGEYQLGINIADKITINGNGFAVDGRNQARAFNVVAGGVCLNNISFVNCYAEDKGGSVFWQGSDGVLSFCNFINSSCYGAKSSYGGAVYWNGNAGLLANATFVNCSARSGFNIGGGGAVSWHTSGGTLFNCSFMNCSITYASSIILHIGGGGALYWSSDNSLIMECTFFKLSEDYDDYILVGKNIRFIPGIRTDLVISKENYFEYGTGKLIALLMTHLLGKSIGNATLEFVIDGEKYTVETQSNGKAELILPILSAGIHKASVSFKGNNLYASSSQNFTIEIYKIQTRVSLYYDDQTNELVATLVNAGTGKAIKGGNIVFNLNGTKTAIKSDKQGQARLAVSGVNLDYFHAAVSYGGNFKYLRSVASINVITGRSTTKISNVYDRQTQEAIATVTNNVTGQAIKGATVVFYIDGVKTALKTDALGQVKISVAGLDLGVNSIASSYSGNSKYTRSTANIYVFKI